MFGLQFVLWLMIWHSQALGSQPVPPNNFHLECFKYGARTVCQYRP